MGKFAKKLLKDIFMKAVKAGMAMVKKLKNMLSKLKFRAIAAEEEMEVGLAAVAVEEAPMLQTQLQIDQK